MNVYMSNRVPVAYRLDILFIYSVSLMVDTKLHVILHVTASDILLLTGILLMLIRLDLSTTMWTEQQTTARSSHQSRLAVSDSVFDSPRERGFPSFRQVLDRKLGIRNTVFLMPRTCCGARKNDRAGPEEVDDAVWAEQQMKTIIDRAGLHLDRSACAHVQLIFRRFLTMYGSVLIFLLWI